MQDVLAARARWSDHRPRHIDIVRATEEMRVGDRLWRSRRARRQLRAARPVRRWTRSIVSVYGNAVTLAGQSQVVVISRGTPKALENGHVLAILKAGASVDDRRSRRARRSSCRRAQRPADGVPHLRAPVVRAGAGNHRRRAIGDRVANPR
jgi:hypothetical protein